jgi:hypothetical protein
MQFLARLVVLLALASASLPAVPQPVQMFSASSKAQGAPFDLLVTETERLPTKSFLSIPGFHERTAPGARWLMCAYTALAVERGFSYWSVVYPAPSSTRVVVALGNATSASPAELLGPDYVKELAVGERMMPVEKMVAFCGIKR